MVPRTRHRRTVLRLLRDFPVVAILGARQVGKTTLALEILKLQKAFLVHAGDRTFPLHERVTAISAARLLEDLAKP